MTKVSADIPSVGFASPNLVQEGWRGGGIGEKKLWKVTTGNSTKSRGFLVSTHFSSDNTKNSPLPLIL